MNTAKITSSTKDGKITWVTINGLDFGTQHEFGNDSFGILENGELLDDDGAPLTIGDYLEIAVNNVLRK